MASMEKLDIRLTKETVGGLDVLAKQYRRTKSEIGRLILETVLNDNKMIEKCLK